MLYRTRVTNDLDVNERDHEGRVAIRDSRPDFTYPQQFDLQFLGQFTPNSVFDRFPIMNLPTRKLPKAAVPLMRWSAADEIASVPLDHGGHNFDGLH